MHIVGLRVACILSLLLIAGSCEDDQSTRRHEAVSIYSLIVNPEKYHGKRIAVLGTFSVGEEHFALAPNPYAALVGDSMSNIWLEEYNSPIEPGDYDELKNAIIHVMGVFDAKSKGHMNGYAGTLRDWEYVVAWRVGAEKAHIE